MFGCPLYIHNTYKACYVTLRGFSYAPIHLDASICVDAPCILGCPHMFGWPPVCLNAAICLDTSCMFAFPPCLDTTYMFVCPPLCLDVPPVCLDTLCMFGLCLDAPIHTQHKENMLCHTKGVSLCPHTFGCPSCLDTPICLDALHMFEHPAVCLGDVWMPPVHTQHVESMLCHMCGHPLYVWMPPMFGCYLCFDAPHV